MLAGSGTDLALGTRRMGRIYCVLHQKALGLGYWFRLLRPDCWKHRNAPPTTTTGSEEETFFLQIRTVRFLIIYSFWRQDGAKGSFYSDSPPAGVAQRDSFDFLRRNPACDARKRTKRGNSIMQKEKVTACKKRRFLLQFPIATRCHWCDDNKTIAWYQLSKI